MELKGNKAPVDIVKLTFDGLLLLMGHKVCSLSGSPVVGFHCCLKDGEFYKYRDMC